MLFHEAAHNLPFRRAYAGFGGPIRDDFHITIRQLHVDQDPVVVLGVPHAEVREHLQRAGTGGHAVQNVQRRQRGFDREANLAGVRTLDACDGLLDGVERCAGEQHACAPVRRCGMANQAPHLHHQLPEAPPPLKPPPPPLKPPPPPLPPKPASPGRGRHTPPPPHPPPPGAPPPPHPPPPPPQTPPPPPRPPKPPPLKPPPRPPPKPPPQPLPADHPREDDPASMANRNATTPAPTPMGSRWLKAQARPPARPPVATDPNSLPNMARSTPLATNTTTSNSGNKWPNPLLCSHFLSGSGNGSPLTTEIILSTPASTPRS